MAAILTALALALLSASAKAQPTAASGCLDLTAHTDLNTAAILQGLGLTPDQVRELRSRLSQYFGFQKFTLDGLGLTAAQISEIQRRIAVQVAAMNAHPLGWPCAPFTHTAAVIRYMKAKLIHNGFRPAMRFFVKSPRQIQFTAILDGQQYYGTVAKSAPRQIRVSLGCARPCSGGGTYTFNLGFVA